MNGSAPRWSQILASGKSEEARSAWSELAANYRSPIHAYFRARFGASAAEQLTETFIAESTSGGAWARTDLERESFRTCLRMLLREHGGHHAEDPSHARSFSDDVDRLVDPGADPEVAFERAFARALVGRALARLRAQQPDPHEHDALLPSLMHRGDHNDLKHLSAELGLPRNTLVNRLRRMRMDLRELLRDEFAQLVKDRTQLTVELLRLQRNLKHRKL
jgi:hypothetical protein